MHFRHDEVLQEHWSDLRSAMKERWPSIDDTAACELIEQPVKLVHVAAPNPKLTTKADIAYIESILRVRV
jgi:2-C-methyl-D-erythritol 4-phosphate cytidylyltransferase